MCQLNLPLMVQNNTSPFETGFTVSIEAKCGVTTGISAADRATTVAAAVADDAKAGDLTRPGHIFPYGPATAVSWCGWGRPKAAWTWPGWPASNRRGHLRNHG
jgi:3,4-dihydroxy-2-butanone 4-phosphate synthase